MHWHPLPLATFLISRVFKDDICTGYFSKVHPISLLHKQTISQIKKERSGVVAEAVWSTPTPTLAPTPTPHPWFNVPACCQVMSLVCPRCKTGPLPELQTMELSEENGNTPTLQVIRPACGPGLRPCGEECCQIDSTSSCPPGHIYIRSTGQCISLF